MKNLLPCAFFILLFSCQQSPKEQAPTNSTEILEKTDSLTVSNVLAQAFLYQGKVNNQYVFRDMVTSDVYLYDQEGKLLNRWDKSGDVPGSFGLASGNFQFDKQGNAVVLDISTGLKVLGLDGSVIQDFRVYQDQVSLGSMIGLFDTEKLIHKNGKEYLLYSLDIIEEYDGKYEPDFFKKRKNLLLADIETNETKKLIPFPEGSQFLNGKVYFFRDIRPLISYDESEGLLYLVFAGDPTLHIYDWSGEEPVLKESKKLDLPGFEQHEGFEPGEVKLGQINDNKKRPYASTIVDINKYGSDLLITYRPTPTDKNAIALIVEGQAPEETKQRLREEAKQRTILLRPDGTIIPVTLPTLRNSSFKVKGDKIIWMKAGDPNVEDEDFTVYWGKLKVN